MNLATAEVPGAAEHAPHRGSRPGRSRACPGRQPLSPDPEGREGAAGQPPSAPAMGPRRRSRKPEVPKRRAASPTPRTPRRRPSGNRPRPLALELCNLAERWARLIPRAHFTEQNTALACGVPGPNLRTSGWRSSAGKQNRAAVEHLLQPAKSRSSEGPGEGSSEGEKGLAPNIKSYYYY